MLGIVAAATPECIRRAAVVVALDVNRILRSYGESAAIGGGGEGAGCCGRQNGQVADASRAHAASYQLESVARSSDRVGQASGVAAGNGEIGVRRRRVGIHAEAIANVLSAPVVEEAVLVDVFGRVAVVGGGLQDSVGSGGG